jgi:hypothetical protein
MRAIDARLAKLETVWRRPDLDGPIRARLSAIFFAARERAVRRYLAEIAWPYGPREWPSDPRWYDHPGHPHWPRKPDRPDFALVMGVEEEPAFAARMDRELDELKSLAVLRGEEAALSRWLNEPEDGRWPPPEWTTEALADRFRRELAHNEEIETR